MNLLSFILFLLSVLLSNQPVNDGDNSAFAGNINYNPKSLQKNLEKITACTNYEKQELDITPSLSDIKVNGKFFRLFCDGSATGYLYIGRVRSCRTGGCSIGNLSDEYEFFDYYTIYDTGLSVVNVTVFNYEASHGQEITVKGWLRQFVGYSHTKPPLVPGKNIDAISGATVSVNGITDDIIEKAEILGELVKADRAISKIVK
jgi:hypothetical protein